ncbi:hypothetical protein ACIP97_13920 [Peribacillus frigoritolerans]|uniref:hypothetical protein n=1 Tax=Peribacillus frigoritolerans TaxID=450367 RepID=UPI0037FE962D
MLQGEVSFPALYENIKKKRKLAKNNGYDIDFKDFVNIIGEVIASDGLSDGQVGELVLTNKAFKEYIKRKNR